MTHPPFREVWAIDFEFLADPGEQPDVVCCVARELRSGRLIRLWRDELPPEPPYPVDPHTLFVSYFASAELGCHLALGWPLPARVIDLYAEFRRITNGRQVPAGRGLLGALTAYGLDGIAAGEKAHMRDLVMRGGPWTASERQAILDYCQSDVDALTTLLPHMWSQIAPDARALDRALLRGAYMAAVARMEHVGIPVDVYTLERLRRRWSEIRGGLVDQVDLDYGVFEGTTFKADRFAAYLARERIPWPRLESGRLALDQDTFREMARAHPKISPLRELRHALSEMRLNDLAVGQTGRNRTLLSPFGARTGRNTPSNSKFIFGPSTWLRSLIKPDPGRALAYIDWSCQEVAVAAVLSGDVALIDAVRSGDPYMTFAQQAGLAPVDATKATHGPIRDACKAVVLGTQYGMQAASLAGRIGCPEIGAVELLNKHRRVYRKFWTWSDAAVDTAMLHGRLYTVFGWQIQIGPDANPRSLRNFPMQANGAEMLRLACCLATERGVTVLCPIHDALLIEGDRDEIGDAILTTRQAMAEASRAVLGGFEIATDVKIVTWPDRYQDPRGAVMWSRVMGLLDRADGDGAYRDRVQHRHFIDTSSTRHRHF